MGDSVRAATVICGPWAEASHGPQAYFLRTCWMRSKRPGRYSICQLFSAPISCRSPPSDSVRQGLRRLQFVCLQGFPLPVQFGGIFANLFGGLTLLVPDTIISVI